MGAPRAIIFDVLFTENERNPREQSTTLSANDQRLVESTASSAVTYHAMQLHNDSHDALNVDLLHRPLPDNIDPLVLARLNRITTTAAFQARTNNSYSLPFPALTQSSHGIGSVNVAADSDGIYRRVPLVESCQGNLFPALGLSALLRSADLLLADDHYRINNTSLPIDSQGHYLINYYGKVANSYSMSGIVASAQQLRAGDVERLLIDPNEFHDKIVFIGASAAGVEDLKATPLAIAQAGVMLHVAVAGNVIANDILTPLATEVTYTIHFLLALLTAGATLYFKRTAIKVLMTLLLGVGYAAIAIQLFQANLVMPLITPLFNIMLGASVVFSYLLFTEGRDKRRVRTMLSQYVSPAVLTAVVDRYEEHLHAEVGSEEQLTIIFSDIRGFTNLAERLPAQQVVALLNHYFSSMTDAIFVHQGTIDKFIGDAIMAFWG
ncbi:MAG: adenylate cyclase, partial [Halothiobacillaceae bacterium]